MTAADTDQITPDLPAMTAIRPTMDPDPTTTNLGAR